MSYKRSTFAIHNFGSRNVAYTVHTLYHSNKSGRNLVTESFFRDYVDSLTLNLSLTYVFSLLKAYNTCQYYFASP